MKVERGGGCKTPKKVPRCKAPKTALVKVVERRNNREQNKNCEKSTTYGDERRDRNRQRRRRVPPPFAHITSEPARHDTFGGQQANNVQERHFDERIKLD